MRKSNALVIWIIAGVLFFGCCGIVGIFGGGMYFLAGKGDKAMKDGQAAGDDMIRQIAQPWNAQAIYDRLDRTSKAQYTLKSIQAIVDELDQKYGPAGSFSGAPFDYRMISTTEDGSFTDVAYSAGVVFQKRAAEIRMVLRKRGDKWYLYQFRVVEQGTQQSSGM